MVDRLLDEGHSVRVIDDLSGGRIANLDHHVGNKSLQIFVQSINNDNNLEEIYGDLDYVFHFAGLGDIVPSINLPEAYLLANSFGSAKVICNLREHSPNLKKLVYAASSSCYGDDPVVPTSERAPINLRYPYALSKFQGEQSLLHLGKLYNLPVNSIRIFNAYGLRSRTSGAYGAVFGVFLKQKLSGKPLTVVGDGLQKRDFVYVTDVVDAFFRVSQIEEQQEIFNLGCGNPVPVSRLVELLGCDHVTIPDRPGEPRVTHADNSKLVKATRWEPKISIEDGVGILVDHIDYWADAPLWEPSSIETATSAWFRAFSN